MTSSLYPYLFATLGDAVERLPDDLAKALETTLGSTMRAHADEGITLLGCLQRIRHVDAADGQPWPDKGRKCFGFAMARIDRANAGLTLLLERLHTIERVRVDGDADQQVGDDVREGLLLGCCWPAVGWPSMWMCSCGWRDAASAAPRPRQSLPQAQGLASNSTVMSPSQREPVVFTISSTASRPAVKRRVERRCIR